MNVTVLVKVILAVFETFAFFALGGFAVERKMVDEQSLRGFSRFAINVLTPFMVFDILTFQIINRFFDPVSVVGIIRMPRISSAALRLIIDVTLGTDTAVQTKEV